MEYRFMMQEKLSKGKSSGVLDTPEKVRGARRELEESIREPFEEIRISRVRGFEVSDDYVLD